MTYKDAFFRGVATGVFVTLAAIPGNAWLDVEPSKGASVAGIAVLLNWAVRFGQAYLDNRKEVGE